MGMSVFSAGVDKYMKKLNNPALFILSWLCLVSLVLSAVGAASVASAVSKGKEIRIAAAAQGRAGADTAPTDEVPVEADIADYSILQRAWDGGIVVFSVLMILFAFSILGLAIILTKFFHLNKIAKASDRFVKSFWDSRSLNDLNSRLGEHSYSPVKEVFRSGYGELVRAGQLREQAASSQIAVTAAMDNLGRALNRARSFERKRMEKYLTFLATIASSSPFIGLFGTVWGIMNAFEGIARTGSASLAAVAPGISEALIATAAGLGAAIPAVMGYNMANSRIRGLVSSIDGFAADFLNIVERYLVTDKNRSQAAGSDTTPIHNQ